MQAASPERKSRLDGLGLSFSESMQGQAGSGEELRFDVRIAIADLGAFLRDPMHAAELSGTVAFPPLGTGLPVRAGQFELFSVDPASGDRRMRYFFRFTASNGETYYLSGRKEIRDDPGLDAVKDMTQMAATVHAGEDESAPVYATAALSFALRDTPGLLASIEVTGARSWLDEVAARTAFASFVWGALRDEYLAGARFFYDTRYENLALSGSLAAGGPRFFFVSGVHDKGFPWGDGELFWDVLLAVEDGSGGWRRYAISDRVLTGLDLDIETGAYSYRGPLFEIPEGSSASFSQMRKGGPGLVQCEAEIEIRFEAKPFGAVSFPFPTVKAVLRRMSSAVAKMLRESLPSESAPGIHISPHTVTLRSGTIRIRPPHGPVREFSIDVSRTAGECESGRFRNLKEPTLLYGYLCAVAPGRPVRVQIASRTMRNERQYWAKDQLDAFLGSVVSRTCSAEIFMEDGTVVVRPLGAHSKGGDIAIPLRKVGVPLLEVNNDHYPTAVFQRRIVEVEDSWGERLLALEEDMSLMRLEAVNSERRVKVASIRDDDKLRALDRALDASGFESALEERLAACGKPRASFRVAIKPNFMFAYDKRDSSTYTDPELVAHLAARLRAMGFERIAVVEAQSTYGEYFDKRSVREVAAYLGYDERDGYEIVDMTLDAGEEREFGPHLKRHPLSRVWSEADFRISFAKNKTHAYAYYSLTLKNIYGALPLANKFREYHCRRDIYHTTMEFLAAFPVHFGLVDAFVSADGPFGVFADPAPNETRTILAGADLVAVDWVAATKMGIDPMVSRYMRLAVNEFGKPAIELAGDANPYRPWLNVPVALTLATHKGMDARYHFGNLLYAAGAQMDETWFRYKGGPLTRLLRKATVPLRRTFFLRTGENPTLWNRAASWFFYRLGF